MLKTLKFDFFSTLKMFAPLYVFYAAVSAAFLLFNSFFSNYSDIYIFILIFICVIFSAFILFKFDDYTYNAVYGSNAYLFAPIPVSLKKFMLSKLICGTIAFSVLPLICVIVLALNFELFESQFQTYLFFAFPEYDLFLSAFIFKAMQELGFWTISVSMLSQGLCFFGGKRHRGLTPVIFAACFGITAVFFEILIVNFRFKNEVLEKTAYLSAAELSALIFGILSFIFVCLIANKRQEVF